MMRINPQPEACTTFISANCGPILIIKADGRLVRGDGFRTDDEASVAFFDCLAQHLPTYLAALRERAETAERKLAELTAGRP
jgi:hypothetical protein